MIGLGDPRLDRVGGFYDCFVCGHKVPEARAWGFEIKGGTYARGHSECLSGFTPPQLEMLYYAAIHDVFSLRGIEPLWQRLERLGITRQASGERQNA